MNNLEPLLMMEERKWRSRRHRVAGSLILALHHMTDKFESKSTRTKESRRKLHASKTKLVQIIQTVKKLEREVQRKKNRLQRSVSQLNAAIEEAKNTQTPNEFSEEQNIIGQTQIHVRNAQQQIDQVELELHTDNAMIESNMDRSNQPSVPPNTVSIAVEITDLDSSGALEQNGCSKFNCVQKCCVCLETDINCVLYPCAHPCCCFTCASKLLNEDKKCPICYRSPKNVIKTYFT